MTVFETEWSTQYQEVEEEECSEAAPACRTEYNNICSPITRQQCQTSQDTQCVTVNKEVCNEVIDVVNVKSASCDPGAQGIDESTGCQYKWEGKGEDMRWVVIPGTCSSDCTYDPTNVPR